MNDVFIHNGEEAYYKSLPFEELIQKVYSQTSTNIPNEYNIDLTLESRPEYSTNSDLIFKRKGKLNDLDAPQLLMILHLTKNLILTKVYSKI